MCRFIFRHLVLLGKARVKEATEPVVLHLLFGLELLPTCRQDLQSQKKNIYICST